MSFNTCIFCNNKIEIDKKNIFLNRSFSSKFCKTKESKSDNSHSFSVGSCSKCKVNCIMSNSANKLLGFLNNKVKNREPEFHLRNVAEQIVNFLDIPKQDFLIKSFSYKDFFLESQLLELKSKYNLDNLLKDESLNKIKKKKNIQKIWIFRRSIEHIKNYKYLNDLLKKISFGDLFILEILDFQKLFDNKDISFIWDERVFYPSIDYLEKFFLKKGFKALKTLNFDHNEPFSVIIFVKENKRKEKESLTEYQKLYDKNLLNIKFINNHLLKKAKNYFRNYKKIAFFGAGHKSLTAANYLLEFFCFSNIAIFDSSEQKIDTFWNKIKILEPNQSLNNKFDLYIFSYVGKNANLTQELISSSNPKAKFIHISEFFKYEKLN